MEKVINLLWRLSTIILIITIFFVLFIYRPIKWLLTGKYYPTNIKKTLLYKWNKKTGLNMN